MTESKQGKKTKKAEKSQFHTLTGYQMMEKQRVTKAMEDYLEMMFRIEEGSGAVRMTHLAQQLNVRPSSVTKMAGRLRELELMEYEPYGLINLTPKGRELGEYFFWRHRVLEEFFCALNGSQSPLKLVERIEHFVDRQTLQNMEAVLKKGLLTPQ